MPPKVNLEYDHLYHIFNRGNNRRKIFFESTNYYYFLKLYFKHIPPIAKTYAYALLPDHFHFVLSIRSKNVIPSKYNSPAKLSQPFSNMFNAYTKAMNKRYHMVSSLFEDRFERLPLKDDNHFTNAIAYVHSNPQKHKIIDDFRTYEFTSYQSYINENTEALEYNEVFDWFRGKEKFMEHHNMVYQKLKAPHDGLDIPGFQNLERLGLQNHDILNP
jgi:putative transposase